MSSLTPEHLYAVRLLGNAIVDTVRDEHPLPCPENMLYLAFSASGGTISIWTQMIDALIAVGRLKKVGSYQLVLGPKELTK